MAATSQAALPAPPVPQSAASLPPNAQLKRRSMPLYLRLWLAVVLAVAVVTLIIGLLWRTNAEQAPPRQIIISNDAGDVLGEASVRPVRVPGQGVEFLVAMKDGSTLHVQLPQRRNPTLVPAPRRWLRGPEGLALMLGLIALAVAAGSYPIVRRLTLRLERLQRGVQQWGAGDLSSRVPVQGNDEVAVLAQRFNEAAEQVQVLLQAHKSLLANASHELRSPLARIRMGIELMGSAPSATFKAEISRNIGELDQLIEEILLASRLDTKEADLGTVEAVDLIGMAAEECARTGAELEVNAAGDVLARGVVKLLRRVLRNLLENARRYSGGPVSLSLSREPAPQGRQGNQAVIRVRDRGPGVPPDQRERIFEPFYRLPGASEHSGGVGLGLALVKTIVLRHGGSVHCEENPGGGACFVVRLPAA